MKFEDYNEVVFHPNFSVYMVLNSFIIIDSQYGKTGLKVSGLLDACALETVETLKNEEALEADQTLEALETLMAVENLPKLSN